MELTGLQNPMVKAAAELKQKKYRQQQGLSWRKACVLWRRQCVTVPCRAFFILRLRMTVPALCWSRLRPSRLSLFA